MANCLKTFIPKLVRSHSNTSEKRQGKIVKLAFRTQPVETLHSIQTES